MRVSFSASIIFSDFCLSVGLEFVECVGVVMVRVGSCAWVVYSCVDEFFGKVEERCDFGAFGLEDFDVVFFVEGLLHDFLKVFVHDVDEVVLVVK